MSAPQLCFGLDDVPDPMFKAMIYINDVTPASGAFTYLTNFTGHIPRMSSTRVGPGMPRLKSTFSSTRIPPDFLNSISLLTKATSYIGQAGSFALFSPNIIHKASTPYSLGNRRRALFLYLRPLSFQLSSPQSLHLKR